MIFLQVHTTINVGGHPVSPDAAIYST